MKSAQKIVKIEAATPGRWRALLRCGHERWFTQKTWPRRAFICCPHGCLPTRDGQPTKTR